MHWKKMTLMGVVALAIPTLFLAHSSYNKGLTHQGDEALLSSNTHWKENPFAISCADNNELSNEDYLAIQEEMRKVDIWPLIERLYPKDQKGYAEADDFYARTNRGLSQVLIDPEKGHFPVRKLEKIGKGSDMCFVSCAAYDGVRSALLQSIPEALEAAGFHGYFYYRIGGFPNPTGKEIKYVGVPYVFKIFMMLEAQKLGFDRVIWIDSALLPLKDPTPLFKRLDKKEVFLNGFGTPSDSWRYILPATQQLLKELTGTDLFNCETMYVNTTIFGLRMDRPLVKQFISNYYDMVERGTPFLSCFPEEVVMTALIGKPEFHRWKRHNVHHLFRCGSEDGALRIAIDEDYFFYLRRH